MTGIRRLVVLSTPGVSDPVGVFPPYRKGDKARHDRAHVNEHIGQIAEVQVPQHVNAEIRRGEECGERDAGDIEDEFDKIAFFESP